MSQWQSDCASVSFVFPPGPFTKVQQHNHRVKALKGQRELRRKNRGEGRGEGRQEGNHRTGDELSSPLLSVCLSVCPTLSIPAEPGSAFPSEDQGEGSLLWSSPCSSFGSCLCCKCRIRDTGMSAGLEPGFVTGCLSPVARCFQGCPNWPQFLGHHHYS